MSADNLYYLIDGFALAWAVMLLFLTANTLRLQRKLRKVLRRQESLLREQEVLKSNMRAALAEYKRHRDANA